MYNFKVEPQQRLLDALVPLVFKNRPSKSIAQYLDYQIAPDIVKLLRETDLTAPVEPGDIGTVAQYKSMLQSGLNEPYYKRYFTLLLYIEELEKKKELSNCDMLDVSLWRESCRDYLRLNVPGLADKNPNIVLGDVVTIERREKCFELEVDKLDLDKNFIVFKRNHEFAAFIFENAANRRSRNCNAKFNLNRSTLVSMHRALYIVDKERLWNLFPPAFPVPNAPANVPKDIKWFDPNVGDNDMQSQAVRNIVGGMAWPQ